MIKIYHFINLNILIKLPYLIIILNLIDFKVKIFFK